MSCVDPTLSAAANLYILASAMLLAAQRAWVVGLPARLWRGVRQLARRLGRARLPAGVVSLHDPERLAGAGNKALRLAQLKAAGVQVSDGCVLNPPFLAELTRRSPRWRRRQLRRLWRRLGSRPLAVRSSGAAEDGAALSFAGVYESVLDVDRAGLEAAIARVVASFATARAQSYGSKGEAETTANVLLIS